MASANSDEVLLRPATSDDVETLADLHFRVREAVVPFMAPNPNPLDEVRAWAQTWDLDAWDVWVAEAGREVVAYVIVAADWLHSLYVAPGAARHGIGSALLDLVKGLRPDGFCLWVFESNTPARDFYRRHDLVELERTDGSANEERSPDIRMAWPGRDPLRFYRGLIDEVDEQLGDLLARRTALTRAVQGHKGDATRDPARERVIAEALARRAPALGADRLARIVDVIITESLDASGE